jgi:hypothetical protein
MSQSREKDEDRMVQLTLSNAVDQTQKIRVEVPAGTTVAQAARDAGIAPKGSFDVFTPGGEAVTGTSVDQHRNAVLYIGPQKVAGGAEEFILEPEPGVEVVAGPPVGPKAVVFVSSYDSSVRHDVVPQEGQSVRDAARMAGLAPRDGSGWEVFDAVGVEVGNRAAMELTGEVLYVGPRAIEAGGWLGKWSSPGLTADDFLHMKISYPSVVSISNLKLASGNSGVVQVSMIGKQSHRTDKTITYHIVIDFRGFPAEVPNAYVRVPDDSQILHCNIYHADRISFAPRIPLCAVCIGNYNDEFLNLPKDRLCRLDCYLNQLQYALYNPNPRDTARCV